MTYQVYDGDLGEVRDATPEEVADIEARLAQAAKPIVPEKVTRRQARQALLLRGLLDKVQPAIDAIADPTQKGLAQIEWNDSQDFERHRPLLIQIGIAIGLDDAGLDDLFTYASTL